MGKITAIIIDDEQSARNVLTNLLERISSDISIIAKCINLTEGVKEIKNLNPDVVFLDVQMPNYAGYEIVNFFNVIDFEIIFITAYDHYAIKAFELNAIDYLVKPIDRKKLAKAIDRIELKITQKNNLIDYQTLLKTINNKNYNKLVLPELGNRRVINLEDIIAIEADGAYSKIYLKENKCITTSKNLKHFENILPKKSFFKRTHRAWIVNLNFISSINKTDLSISLCKSLIIAKVSRTRINYFENII